MDSDGLAVRLFGLRPERARELGICLRCRLAVEPGSWASLEDELEYDRTALCPTCLATLCPPETEPPGDADG